MTDEQKEHVLAECLEAFHRQRALGERPEPESFRERLGDLFEDFLELVAAETAIDEALDLPQDMQLPQAWGKYTILREIARGAAGVVYEAVHRELGRTVALKVLRTGLDTDDVTRERFRREAQALAQVEHDHIVKLFEFGELDGRPYYAMSLVNGPTLADLVKRGQAPAPRDVCAGLAGVADALQHLHETGIIHRDVKPSNIMIAPGGRYMLADFGLARTAAAMDITRTGDALGTPLYMSPEQMLGDRQAIDARTDVYGLGATLYQMLTGRPPFKTENLHALMRMVLSQRPERASAVKPDLPAGCSRIAMKCLEKEPRDRYASAAELKEDLRRFVEGERVSGRPLSLPARALRLVTRHPALSLAATVVVAVGVWAALHTPPPRLSVQTFPEAVLAQVSVNQGDLLDAPATYPITPGEQYTVRIVPKDAAYRVMDYPPLMGVKEGLRISVLLEPKDTNNPAAIEAARKRAGVQGVEEDKPLNVERGGDEGPPLELRFPRGAVRLDDVRRWEGFVTEDFPREIGVLVFQVEGAELGRVPFPEPTTQLTSGDMPPEILQELAALAPGTRVTWSYVGKDGTTRGIPAEFHLVDPRVARELEPAFARIAGTLKGWSDETREPTEAALHAELLLARQLYTAAAVELAPFFGRAPRHPPTQRLVILEKQALEGIRDQMVARAGEVSPREASRVRAEFDTWDLWGGLALAAGAYTPEQWAAYRAARAKAR